MAHYSCCQCGRDYAYALETCTWCGVPLEERQSASGLIEAVTEVMVPSLGHEDVPYWCALVKADDGAREIVKLDVASSVGERIALGGEPAADLAVVGILGTGVMGRGLAELLLGRGHEVVWWGRSRRSLDSAAERLFDRLARVLDEDEVCMIRTRLSVSEDLGCLEPCDVVIEAVVEEQEQKREVLKRAEISMRPEAVLATNTSGLSLDELAAGLQNPERFGALHFFNPATRMRLVETAICTKTSPGTARFLDAFARSLGKIPVRVSATPAFAVNRALMPLLNEAVRELEEGVATAESIDEAVRLGLNHPMGPLALADLIGLDVVVNIMDNLAERTGDETYAPRPLLRRLVDEGCLGRKSGGGFYGYDRGPRG